VCGLLTLLSGARADPGARLRVSARSATGFGEREIDVPVGPRAGWIDPALLTLLEDHMSAYVGLATREAGGHVSARQLFRAPGHWRYPLEYQGSAWEWPRNSLAAAQKRVDRFALPASAIVFGGSPKAGDGYTLTALYGLAEPLEVRTPEEQACAAWCIGEPGARARRPRTAADATVADLVVPMPGTLVREQIDQEHIAIGSLIEPERRYRLKSILDAVRKESRS